MQEAPDCGVREASLEKVPREPIGGVASGRGGSWLEGTRCRGSGAAPGERGWDPEGVDWQRPHIQDWERQPGPQEAGVWVWGIQQALGAGGLGGPVLTRSQMRLGHVPTKL